MKKTAIVFLIILTVFCFAACKKAPSVEKEPETTQAPEPIDPKRDPAAFLEAAGNKLRNADSFELTMWHWNYNFYANKQEDLATFHSEIEPSFYLYKMRYDSDLDGSPASYLTLHRTSDPNEYFAWSYFHGNTGYTVSDKDHFKHVCEENFSAKQYFWFLNNGMDIENDKLFDNFSAWGWKDNLY